MRGERAGLLVIVALAVVFLGHLLVMLSDVGHVERDWVFVKEIVTLKMVSLEAI
jgi:hypothetical protein